VVEAWFLRALFWGLKIFLGFRIYFWAVAISRMVRGKTNAKDAEGNAKDAREPFARGHAPAGGCFKSSTLIRKDDESSCVDRGFLLARLEDFLE
jgi:hypothetical protein